MYCETLAFQEVPRKRKVRLAVTPPKVVKYSINGRIHRQMVREESLQAGLPKELLRRFPVRIKHTHRRLNVVALEIDASRSEEFCAFLNWIGLPFELGTRVYPLLHESAPMIQAPSLWKNGFTGKGIRIALLDTGVDRKHADLKERIVAYRNFTGFHGEDDVGHGTHCAGILCGNGRKYRGIASGAELICGKVLGKQGGESDDIVAGLSWAASRGAQIISLSLGGPGNPKDLMCRECDALAEDGILVVVAAGNEGPARETICSPGCARSVVTVGAVDKEKKLAFYSSRGPVRDGKKKIPKPDLLAPGGGVLRGEKASSCSYPRGITSSKSAHAPVDPCDQGLSYTRMSGTSMATPHVSGLAALLLEMDPKLDTPAKLKKRLKQCCLSLELSAEEQGAGLIQAPKD